MNSHKKRLFVAPSIVLHNGHLFKYDEVREKVKRRKKKRKIVEAITVLKPEKPITQESPRILKR